jgi:two-component system NtrC family response regulator
VLLTGSILVIHSDHAFCQTITAAANRLGHTAVCVDTLAAGLQKIQAEPYTIALLDARLPGGNGLDGILRIKEGARSPEIIVVTDRGDPDEAEQAIANGAWDYLEKAAVPEFIKLHVGQILEYRAEKGPRKSPVDLDRKEIIGNSSRLNLSLDLLAQAAQSDVNVLIAGETGTGKELFAKAIHRNSPRAGENFVIVDCTALPETLVESILFGHTRGAFTGAYLSQEGLVKQADKGTLFLDEIGELPLGLQKSFLRVIQEHRFRPVGGNLEIASNFRLVVATNRDLDQMVKQGTFREDLLFRLRSLVIALPSLRERLDDIKELTLHYMGALCRRFRLEPKGFSPDFWRIVHNYPWPGNVRELIQALEKALLSARDEPIIFPKDLPTNIRIQVARNNFSGKPAVNDAPGSHTAPPPARPSLKEFHRAALSAAEKQYFADLMASTHGDIEEVCRISGLSRSRLYALLKKFGLTSSSRDKG